MRSLPFLLVALLTVPAAIHGQEPSPLEGRSLLEWMGLKPGDTQVFQADGEQLCVTVEEPRSIRGRSYAELRGLRWPGLASDSRILVPLDGSIGLSAIATPGPRPNPRPLLSPLRSLRVDLPSGTDLGVLTDPRSTLQNVEDGWYAVGPRDDPRALAYVWCSVCSDAGTRVVLEKGGGIRSVTRTTIAGTETLRRVDDVMCAERPEAGVEFQIYLLPQDDDRP